MRTLGKLAFGLVVAAGPAAAADIFRAEPIEQSFYHAFPQETIGEPLNIGDAFSFAGSPHFRIEGRIEPGDSDKLAALLREELPDPNSDWSNNVVVSLNSDGGDFYEGLALADAIGGFAVMTFVGPGDRCLSSCAIAFMGGQNIMLRGMPAWPARYVHDEAFVGFHAPFSELPAAIQLPEGTPLNDSLMEQITRQFYGQAQAAINEIARRMSGWELSPDFVFAMLTKESREEDLRPLSEQYVPIGSLKRARETGSTVLTSGVGYPATVGYLDALGACNFLFGVATDGAGIFLYGTNGAAFVNDDVITEAQFSRYDDGGQAVYKSVQTSGERFAKLIVENGVTRLIPGNDPKSYYFDTPTRGLGRASCSVFPFDDGRWYAKTYNENVHFPENEGRYLGNRLLDFETPVPITQHMTLGLGGSWSAGPVLSEEDTSTYPEAVRSITVPSFDCGGSLDAAAEVICEEPQLAAADGRMGALFALAREGDPDGVLAAQRQWLKARNRACRPDDIDRSVSILRNSLAECLMGFTTDRNRVLAQGL